MEILFGLAVLIARWRVAWSLAAAGLLSAAALGELWGLELPMRVGLYFALTGLYTLGLLALAARR